MLNMRMYLPAMCMIVAAFGLPIAARAALSNIEWTRQLGTFTNDNSYGVLADGLGNVYISGETRGSLGGANVGGWDAFLSKYDSSGSLLWTEQLGTSDGDQSNGVSIDELGNVYISGYTGGSLGGANAGDYDAFLSKYDSSGNLLWTEQLGTSARDTSYGVSADGLGNIYISGWTKGSLGGAHAGNSDAFLIKYNSLGSLLWTEQLGTSSNDRSNSVSADGLGNVYISGDTKGSLGGANAGYDDAYVSKYDSSGRLLWTEQLGTSDSDNSWGVSADGLGNVYIAGSTAGNLDGASAGKLDAFLSKYDGAGNLQWTRQFGTNQDDYGLDVWADALGSIYITGRASGSLGGAHAGQHDVFVSKFDSSGDLLWTEQFGSNTNEVGLGVSADSLGGIYVSGYTRGDLDGPNAGATDAFVAKIIPEPSTLTLAALGLLGLGLIRRRRLPCCSRG